MKWMEHSSRGLEAEGELLKGASDRKDEKRRDLKSRDKIPPAGDTGEDRASQVTGSRSHWSQNLGGKQT